MSRGDSRLEADERDVLTGGGARSPRPRGSTPSPAVQPACALHRREPGPAREPLPSPPYASASPLRSACTPAASSIRPRAPVCARLPLCPSHPRPPYRFRASSTGCEAGAFGRPSGWKRSRRGGKRGRAGVAPSPLTRSPRTRGRAAQHGSGAKSRLTAWWADCRLTCVHRGRTKGESPSREPSGRRRKPCSAARISPRLMTSFHLLIFLFPLPFPLISPGPVPRLPVLTAL